MRTPGKKGRIIGLTGPTGSGKTRVGRMMARWDSVAVINADEVSHAVADEDPDCVNALRNAFGADLYRTGSLDRETLGQLVFRDRKELRRLESVLFPFILRSCLERADRAAEEGKPVSVLDAPTLFESGADRFCDAVVVVLCPEAIRFRRIRKRDGLSAGMALARMASQPGEEYYAGRADFIIHNDRGPFHLRREVERCRRFLQL